MSSCATPSAFSAVSAVVLTTVLLGGTAVPATSVAAQTDFYNLDKDRPLRVEDAYATKRWAFELQGSPLTLNQTREGELHYAPSLELKHGLLPGFEISVGSHLDVSRSGTETSTTLGRVEVSGLANLWVETQRLPAVGIRVTGHVPTRSDAEADLEVRALVTRGVAGPVRAHINGAWLTGDGAREEWWAGLALDWTLPFHHTLLLAEGWVADGGEGDATFHTGTGGRIQLSPTLTLDAGVGRDWRGETGRDWSLTLGLTHEFAVRGLIPGPSR